MPAPDGTEKTRILILGAGPTGLGAAWRLHELGEDNWVVFERSDRVGGLSASFRDELNYTWDVGGHVLFSHYDYFDQVLDTIMPGPEQWCSHERESWIRIQGRWVPYPFQMNIRHLKPEPFLECLRGLLELRKAGEGDPPDNFGRWIDASFGEGIARLFLRPYNWKVWGHPLEKMPWNWVGDRVATVDVMRIIENYVHQRDDVSWGPNHRFRFPSFGGTGAIWTNLSMRLPANKVRLNEECRKIDLDSRKAHFRSGRVEEFDFLLSTMDLQQLCGISKIKERFRDVDDLGIASTHVVGLGIRGTTPGELAKKCWVYFPEDDSPFYRVTHFSHYSPNNVPDITKGWSLMAEVSQTSFKSVDASRVVESVIQGLLDSGLLDDRTLVENVWYRFFPATYPVPTLERDSIVEPVLACLRERGVYSRGRMGAWKYEVGNMDHSFMQGKEWVDHVFFGAEEVTLHRPHIVNASKK